MTAEEPGMTAEEPGMTAEEPGMTAEEPGMTAEGEPEPYPLVSRPQPHNSVYNQMLDSRIQSIKITTMAIILNTRSGAQATAFSLALAHAGHTSIHCPAMTIAPTRLDTLNILGSSQFDTIIFVSQNAATLARPYINEAWQACNIFAVGPATASALPDFLRAKHPKADFSSAGLLAIPELQQIQNKKIAIICGLGTNQALSAELLARNAAVTILPIYERTLCTSSIEKIQQIQSIDIITSFSAASLKFLNELITKAHASSLKNKPLIVVSEQMITLALELGFDGEVYLAKSATVAAMLAATHAILSG
jgi:uroporphyrinogen-III synthase